MKTLCTTMAAVLLAGAWATAAAAEPEGPAEQDWTVYNKLIGELRGDHARLAGAYKTAVIQARENRGEASTEIRAEILALRERIDRKSVRLMLVAGRHDWPVPEFSTDGFNADKGPAAPTAREQLLPSDPVIAGVLADQARRLAARVRLPLISVGPAGKRS